MYTECSLELPALEPDAFVVVSTIDKKWVPTIARGCARCQQGTASFYSAPPMLIRARNANAFQARAMIKNLKLDPKPELVHLKVDGDMTNEDLAMEVLDVGGFAVVRREMRESTALGSALLAVSTYRWLVPMGHHGV